MKKVNIFKTIMTILFGLIVFGGYFCIIFDAFAEKIPTNYIYFACVCACFLLSLLFVKVKNRSLIVTIALAVTVVADYFLVLNLSGAEENRLIGLCVFCGVQLLYAIYTLTLNRSIGARVINLALRVAVCMIAYFVIPLYFEVGTIELLSIMYIANFVISIFYLLVHIKSQLLMLIGYLLFFVCDVFIGLTNGGAGLLGVSAEFLNFIMTYDIAFYCYIPGLFIIALSTVWKKEKSK